MGIKDILQLEKENTQILLIKEGLFWKAYERSAYMFIKHIKTYRLTKKFYKNVKQEVVYLGFPQNSISNIKSICKEKKLELQIENNQIIISGFRGFNKDEFVSWKKDIQLFSVSSTQNRTDTIISPSENKLVEKIKSFNLINKTPIECQQFIVELQTELKP